MNRVATALALLLSSAPALAVAGAPEFCADRPGLTTGTCTAAPGTFQLETSFVEWSHAGGEEELAIAASRLRYGLGSQTDLHLVLTPYLRAHGDNETTKGIDDLSIALKHVLTDANAPIAVAVMPFVKLPTGSQAISNRRWEGGVLLPIEATLSGPWSLTLTPEVDWNADGDGHGYHPALSLGVTLGVGLTPRWSASIDGFTAWERDGGKTLRETVAAVSLAFLAAPALQLDAQIDLGLNRDAADVKLTSGIAFRF